MAKEIVESPMPGVIRAVNVSPGERVNENDILCILEAMKMENPIIAPIQGTVSEVNVSVGQSVKRRDTLVVIEY